MGPKLILSGLSWFFFVGFVLVFLGGNYGPDAAEIEN